MHRYTDHKAYSKNMRKRIPGPLDSITVQQLLPNNRTELHTCMFTVAEREELTATGSWGNGCKKLTCT